MRSPCFESVCIADIAHKCISRLAAERLSISAERLHRIRGAGLTSYQNWLVRLRRHVREGAYKRRWKAPSAKSSLFRVAFQSFRGCVQSSLLSGMVNHSLWHQRRRGLAQKIPRCRLVHGSRGRSPSKVGRRPRERWSSHFRAVRYQWLPMSLISVFLGLWKVATKSGFSAILLS